MAVNIPTGFYKVGATKMFGPLPSDIPLFHTEFRGTGSVFK
jgi:hypothetical protein